MAHGRRGTGGIFGVGSGFGGSSLGGGGGSGGRFRLKTAKQKETESKALKETQAKEFLQRGVQTKGLSGRAKAKIKTIKEFTRTGRISHTEAKKLVEQAKKLKD